MPVYRGNCEGEAGCCPGVLHYQSRRVFYNLLQRAVLTPAQQQWAQPTQITDLLVAHADGGDQAQAVVTLHAVSCIREYLGGPPGISPGPGVELANPSQIPPIAQTFAIAPEPNLDCTETTVGRGAGTPQYRVRFRDVTRDDVLVFVDGSSVLSLPASQVDVDLLTSPAQFILDPGPPDTQPPVLDIGLYVDAEASASVSWGSRNGSDGALGGMATFTQTQLVQDDGEPIGPTPAIMLFERPPFAKRLSLVWGAALQEVNQVLFVAEFLSGATRDMGLVPLGVMAVGQGEQTHVYVPDPVTHVRITPLPAAIPGARGAPIHCIWQIGVR